MGILRCAQSWSWLPAAIMSMCAIHAIRAIRATVYMLCMLFTIGATGAMRTIHKGGVAIRTIGAKELHSDYRDYSAYSSAKFFPDA